MMKAQPVAPVVARPILPDSHPSDPSLRHAKQEGMMLRAPAHRLFNASPGPILVNSCCNAA
jgi:hypothetical protein